MQQLHTYKCSNTRLLSTNMHAQNAKCTCLERSTQYVVGLNPSKGSFENRESRPGRVSFLSCIPLSVEFGVIGGFITPALTSLSSPVYQVSCLALYTPDLDSAN